MVGEQKRRACNGSKALKGFDVCAVDSVFVHIITMSQSCGRVEWEQDRVGGGGGEGYFANVPRVSCRHGTRCRTACLGRSARLNASCAPDLFQNSIAG